MACYGRLIVWLGDGHCLVMGTAWWWGRLGGEDGLVVGTTWWWERLGGEDGLMVRGWLGDEDDLMMRTAWWWGRLDDENGLMMRTIYLPTLNWADKEFFLTFLYIASLGQAWQNPSNINPKVGLRALISSTRSNTNPRIGFELLSETQLYGQATVDRERHNHKRRLHSCSIMSLSCLCSCFKRCEFAL